jgi:hypothetical protein
MIKRQQYKKHMKNNYEIMDDDSSSTCSSGYEISIDEKCKVDIKDCVYEKTLSSLQYVGKNMLQGILFGMGFCIGNILIIMSTNI